MSGRVANLCREELGQAERLLADLAAAGVAVEPVDGRVRLSPASAAGVALRARVAAHKPAILALLAGRQAAAKADEYRELVELVAESCRLPPDVLEGARRGDRETPEEARVRQAAATERLRLGREAFVEECRRAGLYRGLASDTEAGL
jgi:hypothetical protein